MKRLTTVLSALVFTLCLGHAETSAQTLVVNGEQIADAKLYAAAKAEGRIDLYGSYPSESMLVILNQFKKDTGIEFEYVRLPSFKMYDRVLAEFEAGKFTADYADLTDLSLIKNWVERGIFATHKVPTHDKIPAELKDPQGRWYYIVRPIYVLGVNSALVKEADYPKSWRDTFDPKWKGIIGLPGIDAGGSALTLHSFLRIKIGEDSWAKLAAIEPRTYASAAPVVNDLVRGRIHIAYGGAASLMAQIKKGAPLKIIFPTEGLAAFGAMGNVTSTAKHPNAAKLFMNYMTSKRGSAAAASTGSYGTHPDAPAPSDAGYKFPPPSQVWTIAPDQWEKIHETWPPEWKRVFQQK